MHDSTLRYLFREMDIEATEKRGEVPVNYGEQSPWGYIVCFGTVITFVAGIGHVNSFGLIYNDFLNDSRSTAKSLTTSHGVFTIMLAVGGIILNSITKRFSLRVGGLIGAMLFSVGSFSTIPISNTNQLPLTFGILQGLGFGMMVPVCYSHLNYYFVKKRTTWMSICKAVQGVILMLYPQLLKEIMHYYGFRGTLLLIAGISLHTFPGMMVMWTPKNLQKKYIANESEDGINKHANKGLLKPKECKTSPGPKHFKPKYFCEKLRSKLSEHLHVKILKDAGFCNICVGQSFVNFSDLTFFILQPMLLFQYNYDKTQVAMCISICTAADVAGRCALAVISNFIPINTRLIFYMATFFTFFIRLVMLQINQFIWMAVVTAALGMLRALLHVASPLVISSHVSLEDFPGAYALFMLTAGLVNVTCSPFIGLLRDEYQDYIPAFYALTLCCIPCLIFWPLEYIFKRK